MIGHHANFNLAFEALCLGIDRVIFFTFFKRAITGLYFLFIFILIQTNIITFLQQKLCKNVNPVKGLGIQTRNLHRPLFRLFPVFFKQTSLQFFLHINVKNVHPVHGARTQIHDLRNMSLLQ